VIAQGLLLPNPMTSVVCVTDMTGTGCANSYLPLVYSVSAPTSRTIFRVGNCTAAMAARLKVATSPAALVLFAECIAWCDRCGGGT